MMYKSKKGTNAEVSDFKKLGLSENDARIARAALLVYGFASAFRFVNKKLREDTTDVDYQELREGDIIVIPNEEFTKFCNTMTSAIRDDFENCVSDKTAFSIIENWKKLSPDHVYLFPGDSLKQ